MNEAPRFLKSMLTALRKQAVAVRDGMDRALHPRRRRRARARIERLQPSNVLVICLGNVCRSPYAERIWRALNDSS